MFFSSGLIVLVVSFLACAIEIDPTGTGADYTKIQSTLNNLKPGDTIRLKGDFVFNKTIYLPSGIVWILNGKLTLSKNSSLDDVGVVDATVDSRRPTGITEKAGGASKIDMSGGTYDGNKSGSSVRLLNFIRVTNSSFHDMKIVNASDDNLTIGAKSSQNICRNITSAFAGGNALTDKGDYNRWYDCIAEDCVSDGLTPKCRNSEFHRCIARRNGAPGIGCYVRLDGSNDLGENISGNKFLACESYDNKRGGISINIAFNSGKGAIVRNNFIQGRFYNNGCQGVVFRNKQETGIMENNVIDVITYNNKSLLNDGTVMTPESGPGGVATDGFPISGITGSVIAYDNAGADICLLFATRCTLTVYTPYDRKPAKVISLQNSITLKPCSCPALTTDPWCVRTYLQDSCGATDVSGSQWPEKSISYKGSLPSGLTRIFTLDGRKLSGRNESGPAKGIVIQTIRPSVSATANGTKIIR
ncbi:MAG: hypothetical protein MUF22_00700 [Chitinispirillaceae bacterium]|nr:hypothetical protein [Chitinispirillaceae bacterium]